MQDYQEYINEIFPEIVQTRRHLHQFPELSFKEKNTSKFIFDYLKELGFEPFYLENSYSVVCDIFKGDLPYVLLRADIDALPINEDTGLEYASSYENIMHACGHDVHTAILLATANVISKNKAKLKNNVILFFESGEEVCPGGAKQFVESDFFKSKHITAAFALHLSPELETGTIGIRREAFMASSDEIYIDIYGKGGHAAIPDNITNPIKTASEVFLEIYKLNSVKLKSAFIVSIGNFAANGTTNVIPDDANLKGTVRAFCEEDRKYLHNAIIEIIENISKKNRVKASLEIRHGYPAIVNNCAICDVVENNTKNIVPKICIEKIPQRLTSDDFAYIAEKIPSCYLRLGCNSNTKLHTSNFDPDENCMLTGVRLFCKMLLG